MYREIVHISFPSLQELYFYKNEIDTMEGISRIQIPILRKLGLSNSFNNKIDTNQITSVQEYEEIISYACGKCCLEHNKSYTST